MSAFLQKGRPQLILASSSKVRARLLEAAGLAFTDQSPGLDEHAMRQAVGSTGALSPQDISEVLARAIRNQLLGHKIDLSASLVAKPRLPLPEPERPRPVRHRKYLDLVGKHEAHPGTGRGYAASRRKSEDVALENEPAPPAALV